MVLRKADHTHPATKARENVSRCGCEQVPTAAFLAAKVYSGGANAAQNVGAIADRFEMIGVDAISDSAKMVDSLTWGNCPDEKFIDPTMCGLFGEIAISLGIGGSYPNPASIGELNLFQESV